MSWLVGLAQRPALEFGQTAPDDLGRDAQARGADVFQGVVRAVPVGVVRAVVEVDQVDARDVGGHEGQVVVLDRLRRSADVAAEGLAAGGGEEDVEQLAVRVGLGEKAQLFVADQVEQDAGGDGVEFAADAELLDVVVRAVAVVGVDPVPLLDGFFAVDEEEAVADRADRAGGAGGEVAG